MKTEDVRKDCKLDAIKKLLELLDKDGELASITPLELYVWLKRAYKLVDTLLKHTVEQANMEFTTLVSKDPTIKEWVVAEFATISNYTPKGTYIYPPEIVACEAELKKNKAVMQKDGRATLVPGVIDPKKDVAFQVSLKQV